MTQRLTSLDQLRAHIRARRKALRLTQREAAQLIGHTGKWLSSLERGASDPPTSMVLRLMVLFGTPLVAADPPPPDDQGAGDGG